MSRAKCFNSTAVWPQSCSADGISSEKSRLVATAAHPIKFTPVGSLENTLSDESQGLRDGQLWRELRRVDAVEGVHLSIGGRSLVSFASNDYLGLSNHPLLKEAAIHAVERWGTGSAASRLVSGSLAPHHALEESLAAWKGTEAALSFASGFATALGVIPALVGSEDIVILDKLVHACCVDAIRLSGARMRVYRHNDLEDFEAKLRWAVGQRDSARGTQGVRWPRILVVTESVFSMDGDLAPLREIVELKDRHDAWLLLDEAHAVGLFGEHRTGLAEAYELANRVEIHMGTLGKALGCAGGYVAGSRTLIDWLVNRARSFVFSTAPTPAQAESARAAVELVAGPEGVTRAHTLWALVDIAKNELIRSGWPPGLVRSAILPLKIGDEGQALATSVALREAGWYVPAIRYPTVAKGSARLRVTVSANHSREDIRAFAKALAAQRSGIPETMA